MHRLLLTLLALFATPATAQDTSALYDLRILGLKLGEMRIVGRVAGGTYQAKSQFYTTGVTGALSGARFTARSTGRATTNGLKPQRYSEDINTGKRETSARLSYRNGAPRVTGGTLAAEEDRLDPATQRGTLDPMTALFEALRLQPKDGLCQLDLVTFDGARRSSFRLTERAENGTSVTCSGRYTRLQGFSDSAMRRQTVFPFSITYTPMGDLMQARAMQVRSSYGKVTLALR